MVSSLSSILNHKPQKVKSICGSILRRLVESLILFDPRQRNESSASVAQVMTAQSAKGAATESVSTALGAENLRVESLKAAGRFWACRTTGTQISPCGASTATRSLGSWMPSGAALKGRVAKKVISGRGPTGLRPFLRLLQGGLPYKM